MARLLRGNSCVVSCEYYDSEANDYFHEWCCHPDIRDYLDLDEESEYVARCPLTNKSPYDD